MENRKTILTGIGAAVLLACQPAAGAQSGRDAIKPAIAQARARHKGGNTVEILANTGIYTWQLEYRTTTTPPSVLDYQLQPGRVVFTHTGVPPALQGQGLAAQLVTAGLAWAREQGLKVVPACSYVAAFLQRPVAQQVTRDAILLAQGQTGNATGGSAADLRHHLQRCPQTLSVDPNHAVSFLLR